MGSKGGERKVYSGINSQSESYGMSWAKSWCKSGDFGLPRSICGNINGCVTYNNCYTSYSGKH